MSEVSAVAETPIKSYVVFRVDTDQEGHPVADMVTMVHLDTTGIKSYHWPDAAMKEAQVPEDGTYQVAEVSPKTHYQFTVNTVRDIQVVRPD